ncbi:alpha/beta hydrolase family protein [Corynebacterium sp. TAE3-ERU2]|uniref:alpha/beta hydrolase n=1 Tax=Corynebacterium sp. TAE3-ERU2 TaxID=2849497 RepID=UPI001C45B0E5|nr:alpha/beta hydrolase family protein [Corynebacterium sp. TAE3-ERU2]MBV7302484.1 esterase family protein [Corynebacterium sp. TAE3-ERU2]
MNYAASLRRSGRTIAAVLLALCTALGVMVATSSNAQAGNRDWLRPDATGKCEWDKPEHSIQRCDVYSHAMGRNVTVQIQPAGRGGNAGLYMLDGMRALDTANAWTFETDAPTLFLNDNITLVMPVGGAGSFYTDWHGDATVDPRNYVNYKWDTFLSKELPDYLATHFGVARHNNAVIGLSMGGTAAMNLAANHPDRFRQVASFSGYLTQTLPGMEILLGLALLDVGGYNIMNMYSSMADPRRVAEDPFMNMDKLRANGANVYISAASGIPNITRNLPPNVIAAGGLLEASALASTRMWEAKARTAGLNFTTNFPPIGIHDWAQWNFQLHQSEGWILDGMRAR